MQLKIILRQVSLVGELDIFKLRFGGLRGFGIRANCAANAAPQVRLPGHVEGDLISCDDGLLVAETGSAWPE